MEDIIFKIDMMMLKWKVKRQIDNNYYLLIELLYDIKKMMKKGVNLCDSRVVELIHRVNIIGKNNYFNCMNEKEIANIPYKEVKNLSESRDVVEYLISIVKQMKYDVNNKRD